MCVHYNNENVKFEKPAVKSVYISENHLCELFSNSWEVRTFQSIF